MGKSELRGAGGEREAAEGMASEEAEEAIGTKRKG